MRAAASKLVSVLDGTQIEQTLALFRMGISGFVFVVGLYVLQSASGSTVSSCQAALLISGSWFSLNALLLLGSRFRSLPLLRPIISSMVDIVAIAGLQVAASLEVRHAISTLPITSLYFLIIAMNSLRRSYSMVIVTAIASSLLHVATVIFLFLRNPDSIVMNIGFQGNPLDVSLLHELFIAVSIAGFGAIIALVTRDLCRSEQYYHAIFEGTPDGVIIISSRYEIIAANQRFAAMCGLKTAEIVGQPASRFLGSRFGHSQEGFQIGALSNLFSASGHSIPIRVSSVPIRINDETCLELAIRDVSEEEGLVKQLASAQKMETVASLARGLAHDFNNILSGIMGATSLARRTLQKEPDAPLIDKLLMHISVLEDCGDNAGKILGRLNSFTTTTVLPTTAIVLQELITEVSRICRNTFTENIQIEISVPEQPLRVKADDTSLSQALLNLCLNGKDAIGENSGIVSIRARTVSIEEMERIDHIDPTQEYCCIEVKDTGAGMDEETCRRAFDPFFSTKEGGTGIGLAMVSNVAIGHGGTVQVESSPGNGSCFQIYLQRSRDSLIPME